MTQKHDDEEAAFGLNSVHCVPLAKSLGFLEFSHRGSDDHWIERAADYLASAQWCPDKSDQGLERTS